MKKKPELRQLRQLRITEAIFLKKNLNYVNYVITPITQLQKRQNHPLVLPLVTFREGRESYPSLPIEIIFVLTVGYFSRHPDIRERQSAVMH